MNDLAQAMNEPKRQHSEATKARMAKAQLNARQRKFVEEYANSLNGTEAARQAGYAAKRKDKGSPKADNILAAQAWENLRKPKIKAAAEAEIARLKLKITPERVQERLDTISRTAESAGQFGPAVRAEELLGKSIGMWIDQSVTLSGALTGSHVQALLEVAKRRQAEPIDLKDDGEGNWKTSTDD